MILRGLQRKVETFSTLLFLTKPERRLSTAELAQLMPEAILKDEVRSACVKRLKQVNMTKKNEENPNKAAVLIPLCIHKGKLGFLYTLRSHKVSMNRGQVSFPGGKKDKKDATLEDTALRETWEELQIPKNTVDVWGSGNLIDRKNVTVLPVLGFIGEVNPANLNVNNHEVEEAFFHPLEKLCDPALCRYTQFRNSYTLPIYLGGDHKIWGLTAIITHLVMSSLVPELYHHKLRYLHPIQSVQENAQASSEVHGS